MFNPKTARRLIALSVLALTLVSSSAMASSHIGKHGCIRGSKCTYVTTGKHNRTCERGNHTTTKHAQETKHNDRNGHDNHN